MAAERITATRSPISPRGKLSSTKRRKMKSASLASAPGSVLATRAPVSFRSSTVRTSAARTSLRAAETCSAAAPGASIRSMAERFAENSSACAASRRATSAPCRSRARSKSARLKKSGGGVSW